MFAQLRKSFLKPIALFPTSKPKLWAVVRAILASMPVILVSYIKFDFGANEPSDHKFIRELFSHQGTALTLIVGSAFLSIILDLYEAFSRFLQERQVDYTPVIHLTKTLAGLNNVVGAKLASLGQLATETVGLRAREGIDTLLAKCIQPERQIEEIIKQIWIVLTSLTETQRLEIVLVATKDCKPVKFAGYMPQTRKPRDELINANQTFFEFVAKSGSFQCIEDIAKEISERDRKKRTNSRGSGIGTQPYHKIDPDLDVGSICGFPIHDSHLNEIAYVLTIKHEIPKLITKSFRKKYGSLLDHFFVRILLENQLMRIRANGQA